MEFKLAPNADINGSSYQGEVMVAPARLIEVFGQPNDGDNYKVSGEYIFAKVGDEGVIYTLYDWKNTSLYESDLWTPEQFWAQTGPWEFHIGGVRSIIGGGVNFADWLLKAIA